MRKNVVPPSEGRLCVWSPQSPSLRGAQGGESSGWVGFWLGGWVLGGGAHRLLGFLVGCQEVADAPERHSTHGKGVFMWKARLRASCHRQCSRLHPRPQQAIKCPGTHKLEKWFGRALPRGSDRQATAHSRLAKWLTSLAQMVPRVELRVESRNSAAPQGCVSASTRACTGEGGHASFDERFELKVDDALHVGAHDSHNPPSVNNSLPFPFLSSHLLSPPFPATLPPRHVHRLLTAPGFSS